MTLRVGTRKSRLARAQTAMIRREIERVGIPTTEVPVTSEGDVDRTRPLHDLALQGPGAFTRALEEALRRDEIDVAVHSLKDLPLAIDPALPIVAIPRRHDPRDLLVVREDRHDADAPAFLRPGARVGTSSPRRHTQLLSVDPEIVPTDVRGNVDTRLALIDQGVVDALVLAQAGFERGAFEAPQGTRVVALPLDRFPTCPGQGALAIQARAGSRAAAALAPLDDPESRSATAIERAILRELGGGCAMPLGATASGEGDRWRVRATLAGEAWRSEPMVVRVERFGEATDLPALVAKALRNAAPSRPPAAESARLRGRTILFTFDPATARPYLDLARAHGARAEAWPQGAHVALDAPMPLEVWREASWVAIASPRAVEAVAKLAAAPREGSPRFAALGPATARAMRAAGLPVHLVAPHGTGASLARAIAQWTPPAGPVLLPSAAEPLPDLAQGLADAGFTAVAWPVYRTDATLAPSPLPLPVDVLVVASPSAARQVPPNAAMRVVAFGPSTAAALAERAIPVAAVATRRTPSGILEVLP